MNHTDRYERENYTTSNIDQYERGNYITTNNFKIIVNYLNEFFNELIKKAPKEERKNHFAIIFGSWVLPYYLSKKDYCPKPINLDGGGIGRKTLDVDILVPSGTNDLLDLEDNVSFRDPVYVLSLEEDHFDSNTFIEIFPQSVLSEIDTKNKDYCEKGINFSETLENKLWKSLDETTEKVTITDEEGKRIEYDKIRAVKPYMWIAFKIAAWRQRKSDPEKSYGANHRNDIIYLKGSIGDEYFNKIINKMEKELGRCWIDAYNHMIAGEKK